MFLVIAFSEKADGTVDPNKEPPTAWQLDLLLSWLSTLYYHSQESTQNFKIVIGKF